MDIIPIKDNKNKKALLGLLLLAGFILFVLYLPKFFESKIPKACIVDGNCEHEQYLHSLLLYIPSIIVLGFVFGISASYMYFERRMELPLPLPDRKRALLSMLNPSDAKVMGKVLESGGEALQADIARLEGLGKVKAHRVIQRLLRRGVIEKEQKGKINILRLKKEIRDALNA